MSWGAVIVAGTSLVTTMASSRSKSKASNQATDSQIYAAEIGADAQLEAAGIAADATIEGAGIAADATKYAANKAAQTQLEMYYQAREDQLPWLQAGGRALDKLEQLVYAGPGEFEESPGYQFRLSEGNKNILSNQSATGNLASGRTLKALQEYGQEYASNEYDKFLARYYQSLSPYQSLAGLGQTTGAQLGNQAVSTGAGIASAYNQMGGNLASIYSGMGSNLSSIYGARGDALASSYAAQGNAMAANAINQGNIQGGLYEGIAGIVGNLMGNTDFSSLFNSNMQYGTSNWWNSGSGGGNGMAYIT